MATTDSEGFRMTIMSTSITAAPSAAAASAMMRRLGVLAVALVMLVTLVIAGFAEPVYASPTSEIETDDPVPAVEMPLKEIDWDDPSSDQIWNPPGLMSTMGMQVDSFTGASTANSVDGQTNDVSATKLEATGSWSAGSNNGAFTYAIPIGLPPASGPIPDVALSYSSAVHDGRTSGKNNQASWIGDGWGLEQGFIERSYTSCAADTGNGSNNDKFTLTGDLCWDGESNHITVSMAGTNGTLLKDDSSGQWYVESGAAWKIEKLGSPANPSTATSERWRITTEDGTQYLFGAAASTRWTVPVFGNHTGEPCRATAFKDSSCRQAYRWMLEQVVDTSGNMARYHYATETGHYGAAGDPAKRTAFTRSGHLTRIEYGLRASDSSVTATARVVFTTADRCITNCYTSGGVPRDDYWPDVPWDAHCQNAPCDDQLVPAFFDTKRLTTITTQVRNGSSWRDVDEWKLEHEFKDYGDDDQAVLWLKSVQQTGKATGTAITLPKIQFGGIAMPNRVDVGQGIPQIWRWRLTSIKTETGAVVTINYAESECTTSNLPANKHANSMRCYPVKWTPPTFSEPEEDWFHKYVVESIIEQETTTESAAVYSYYQYATAGGGTSALWAWDDSAFTDKKNRSYNHWRGYPQVTVRIGDPDAGPQQVSRTRFYRGMNGQPLPDGGTRSVSLTDAEGNTVTDHRALSGSIFEQLAYNGSQIIEGSTTRYWTKRRASQSHDGGAYEAWLTAPSREDSRRHLAGTSWQRARVSSTYDDLGRPTEITDHGDLGTTSDQTCTRIWYNDSDSANIYILPARDETVSVPCATTPSRPAHVLGANRYFYDGATSISTAPTKGLPTRTDVLDSWPVGGSAAYVATQRSSYDALGRVTRVEDALGRATTTAYTPSGAGPVTKTVTTNAANLSSTTHIDPARGASTKVVDVGGRTTEVTYDALGRTTAVWLPGRDRSAGESASKTFAYTIRNNGPSATTTKTLNAAGGYITSIELYDSLLRLRQTQADSTGGGRVITEQRYDTHGRVDETRGPNFNTSPPSTTMATVERGASPNRVEFRFDAAGRVTDEIQFERHNEMWRTKTTYGGSTAGHLITTQPPAGSPAEGSIRNALDQVIEVRTYRSNQPTGAYDALTYTYTPTGAAATVSDPVGNQWSWDYDLRGRKTAAHNPDSGTTITTYDRAGQITSTTDGRGQSLAFTYDALGRMTERRDGDNTLLAEWTYDTAFGGAGLPASATRYVDGAAYSEEILFYDEAGRAETTEYVIPETEGALAGSYYISQSYYANGQPAYRSYSEMGSISWQTLAYGYNNLDNPTWILSDIDNVSAVIVDDATYTPFGEIQTRRMNSIFDKYAYQGYQYEETTRRVVRTTFDHETLAPVVADVHYLYDPAGNILSVTDRPAGALDRWETQCFNYDAKQRLTEAWSQEGAGQCATSGAQATLGGPGMYWNKYTYDTLGNRASDTLQLTGHGGTPRAFHYPQAGAARPHAPTHVTTTDGTYAVFNYDAAGNTISRDLNGNVQIYEWDAEGRNTDVHDGDNHTRIIYSAGGTRLIRDDGDQATLFLPETELVWNKQANSLETTRYFHHAGQVVAVAKATNLRSWRFVGSDTRGTATHSVNAVSHSNVTVRYFDPFGMNRGERNGEWYGQHGFMAGTEDPNGLTQIGARPYDPLFGRFTATDPVNILADLQQLNGYTYAVNNPLAFSDETGLEPARLDPGSGTRTGIHDVAGLIVDYSGNNGCGTIQGWHVPCGIDLNDALVGTVQELRDRGVPQYSSTFGEGFWDETEVSSTFSNWCWRSDYEKSSPELCGAWDNHTFTNHLQAHEWAIAAAHDANFQNIGANLVLGGGTFKRRTPGQGGKGSNNNSSSSNSSGTTAPKKSCKSFLPGTAVVMADGGTRPIQDIIVGDQVLATDMTTGETGVAEVLHTPGTPATRRDLISIVFENSGDSGSATTIEATAGHAFWTSPPESQPWNGDPASWQPARNLEIGSWLRGSSGTWIQVVGVHYYSEVVTTVNLTVAGAHTYYVAHDEADILVHNCDVGFGINAKKQLNNFINKSLKGSLRPLGRGHTGRWIPKNQRELDAIKAVMLNPVAGKRLSFRMTDPRWHANKGWVKMAQNVNGIEIHYVFNTRSRRVDDYKFKD
jgi:RHS repeat-associated protein